MSRMSARTADIANTVQALTSGLQPLAHASELPHAHGFYAWWGKTGCIERVRSFPNAAPTQRDGYDLLYIGIAPGRMTSKSTVRTRVVGNHIAGNLAASTLRRALAAVLIDHELVLDPVRRSKKVVLPTHKNDELTQWQHANLKLTSHAVERPWELERGVIKALAPPLNSQFNQEHPFYPTLRALRAALASRAT
jgi:hypothetical protein